MTKHRLEAFSDGVFSIVITLLVLNIKLSKNKVMANHELIETLFTSLPDILTFLVSFLVIGVFWIVHHVIFNFVNQITARLLWSNLVYLMTVAIIPLPAYVLSLYPFYSAAIIFYCFTLLLCGVQHYLFLNYIKSNQYIQSSSFDAHSLRKATKAGMFGAVCCLAAIATSFYFPIVSFLFVITALAFYVVWFPKILSRHFFKRN